MQKKITDKEVLVSGKTSFKIEVPYKLIESGPKNGDKPLIVYLHGYGDNLESFMKRIESCMDIPAYHLFIQGPYPIYDRTGKKTVKNWGRAWYLYDGKKKQFIKSLEITSEFIQEIIDNLIKFINVSRICLVGFSMGGYLAGYFSLTRWKHVNDLIVIGARIKTEIVDHTNWDNLKHLNVAAIHGGEDDVVEASRQHDEIKFLIKNGLNAHFQKTEGGHEINKETLFAIKKWLGKFYYKTEA